MKAIIKFGREMRRVINWLCSLGHLLGEIAVFLLLGIVSYTVVMRYVFNNPPTWGEEIGCYIFIFIVWIALGGILKDDHHIVLDLVVDRISSKKQIWLKIATSVVGLIFCLILSWYAARYTLFQYRFNLQSTTLLSVPMWIPYMFIPLGAILISLQYLVKIAEYISLLPDQKNMGGR